MSPKLLKKPIYLIDPERARTIGGAKIVHVIDKEKLGKLIEDSKKESPKRKVKK